MWKHLRMPVTVMTLLVLATFLGVGCMCLMPGKPSKILERELGADEVELARRLRAHVDFLASKPRNRVDAPEHEKAVVEYIERELRAAGHQPIRQPVPTKDGEFHNIIVRIKGSSKPDELVVIGAHWDTRGPTPGADDNASSDTPDTLDWERYPRVVAALRPVLAHFLGVA